MGSTGERLDAFVSDVSTPIRRAVSGCSSCWLGFATGYSIRNGPSIAEDCHTRAGAKTGIPLGGWTPWSYGGLDRIPPDQPRRPDWGDTFGRKDEPGAELDENRAGVRSRPPRCRLPGLWQQANKKLRRIDSAALRRVKIPSPIKVGRSVIRPPRWALDFDRLADQFLPRVLGRR